MMHNVKLNEIYGQYDTWYYIEIRDNNSNTIDEAFNKALPRLNEILLNTDLALHGIDKFVKAVDFWNNNKNNNQEDEWHNFFIDFNWILSQCFSYHLFYLKRKHMLAVRI
jgi:hypothetical protein